MPKLNSSILVNEYLEKLPSFSKGICTLLRECTLNTNLPLKEEIKWGVPVYSNNKLIFGIAGFKNHVSLTFFNGVNLKDEFSLFSNSNNAKQLRIIKFKKVSEVNKNQIIAYMNEAISIENSSIKKVISNEKIVIPKLLKNALEMNKKAFENFSNMAYTYRKEYANHISEAKRETTKLRRLEKVISNLENNIKMNEQYKC